MPQLDIGCVIFLSFAKSDGSNLGRKVNLALGLGEQSAVMGRHCSWIVFV